jgi:ubiquinone/menaquinone biosynthesis C-methylase UbiE/Co/Zn/Cd efflux system component
VSHAHAHGHSHGLVDRSIMRSRAGVRAVLVSLGVLGLTAAAQAVVFVASGSVALLADLIHNAGDALTAIPVGAAFLLRSDRAERWAGYAVVLAIFVSACVALYETILRLIDPRELDHLWALAGAGILGCVGNEIAARVRLRAGRRLDSAALVADGNHARVDAFVSLGVVASAAVVALGLELADPLIGLAITLVILRITWDSWRSVSHRHAPHAHGPRRYDVSLWLRARGRMSAFRREQLDLARVAPGEDVVDVGCGTGTLALAAKRRVGDGRVCGVDPSPERVTRARAKAGRAGLDVEFEQAPAQHLPFADASFDVVLCTLVLHELPREHHARAIAEMRRVLRPGGRVLLVDMGGPQHGRKTPHSHGYVDGRAPFDVEDVVPHLQHAGLAIAARGPVDLELARFERMRYVLASAPR